MNILPNRQFYTLKFKSSRLREFGYKVDTNFDEANELKEVIALADSQILRSIRDITEKEVNLDRVEQLYSERRVCEKKLSNNPNRSDAEEISDRILQIQKEINNTMFIPEYITVVMEHPKHYEYIYNHGFWVNGVKYKRFSCGAGQARVSTVSFVSDDIHEELLKRLNNGRDVSMPIASSKFNAYFGLYSSATQVVSEPRFIVVKDFENKTEFMANYVTETDWDQDDIVEVKSSGEVSMNRTDGMGLISPKQSVKWAEELGLDWVPSQWCVRQSFLKGMLCTFDFHDFCEKKNGGDYVVDTIYKGENGEYIKADLRDYDVIISESQFKLWDSYRNIEEYIKSYRKNKLDWGVSQYTPKEAKDVLKMNYQFIQTLNLDRHDVEKLCEQFVEWIEGVSYDNTSYLLLFLLGVNNTDEKINKFLSGSQNYWVKSLILNHQIKNDRYICLKIKNLLKKKIQNGCMGDIFVDGNFQVLVSDPYGFMQHVCGHRVTGLLKKGEFYSNYWNERGVKRVDAMRSPLTYRSEHVILDLVKNKETEHWYKYCKLGVILNYHGHECVNFGGADFDYDILATTSNKTIIKGVYKGELPVLYDAPKPKKTVFTEDDLYSSDVFSFGSIIGSITNKGSNAYALLPVLEKEYGKDSDECKLVISRLQQCCKAQSAQIDKAKIGRDVKGIPSVWVNKQVINIDAETGGVLDDDETVRRKELYNRTLLNKHPYFFKYRYRDARKKYNKYIDECETTCHQKFKMSVNSLIKLSRKTVAQRDFLRNYYRYMPLTYSDSSVNLLCKHIEEINFNIWQKIKAINCNDIHELYKNHSVSYTEYEYNSVVSILQNYIKGKRFNNLLPTEENIDASRYNSEAIAEYHTDIDCLFDQISQVCKNPYIATNCLVDYFYIHKPSSNKDVLWGTYGKYIFNNVRENSDQEVLFPFSDECGEIKYMNKAYSLRKVEICQ